MEQQVRFCTAPDGVRLAYAVHGDGPAIVRAATWLTHLDFDWESPVWRHWLAALGTGRTVVRYDERGCGLSDRDVDDLIHIKPYQKLIGQILGAAFVVYYGLTLPWTGSVLLNMALAIFWLIGITNAINLLDNMDGLASGIAIIAAGFLALSFANSGQFTEALISADLCRRAARFSGLQLESRRRSSWATAVRCLSDSFWRAPR